MIYTYFGSKEALFEEVGEALVAWHLNEVPLDTSDLPAYAARVFDRYQQYPELMRLVNWDRLERGSSGQRSPHLAEITQGKIDAIRQAQEAGVIDSHFPAPILFELMLALIELRLYATDLPDERVLAERKQAVHDAVARLVEVKSTSHPVGKSSQQA